MVNFWRLDIGQRVVTNLGQFAQPLVFLAPSEQPHRSGQYDHHQCQGTRLHQILIGRKALSVRFGRAPRRYPCPVPELPEVETVRRGLEPVVRGRTVLAAGGHPSERFARGVDVIGSTIGAVSRRGKYLIVHLDDGRGLLIHLGMTGQIRLDDRPDPDPYDRAWWDLDNGARLALRDVRRFGRVEVVGNDLSAVPRLAALGPEPFDPDFTPEILWANLRRSSVRVKTQLLSQRPVAGVGNIYADEALWISRIHPGTRIISRARAISLHAAIISTLSQGIANGGTTLRDYRTVDGGTGSNQHQLQCYGRAGLDCLRCSTPLRRTIVDGRGTTHCPQCQRR